MKRVCEVAQREVCELPELARGLALAGAEGTRWSYDQWHHPSGSISTPRVILDVEQSGNQCGGEMIAGEGKWSVRSWTDNKRETKTLLRRRK